MAEQKQEDKSIEVKHDESATGSSPDYNRPSIIHYDQHRAATHTPSKVKMRFLGAAALLIVSATAGFAGGWLGSRGESTNQTIQKQQIVLKNQGQLISTIAIR